MFEGHYTISKTSLQTDSFCNTTKLPSVLRNPGEDLDDFVVCARACICVCLGRNLYVSYRKYVAKCSAFADEIFSNDDC